MKLIFLCNLIALSLTYSFANVRVDAENLNNGRKFGATFDSMPEAQKWVQKQIKEESWGKKERWVKVLKDENTAQCLEVKQSREEDGKFSHNMCKLAQEFSYQVRELEPEPVKTEEQLESEFLEGKDLSNAELNKIVRKLKKAISAKKQK